MYTTLVPLSFSITIYHVLVVQKLTTIRLLTYGRHLIFILHFRICLQLICSQLYLFASNPSTFHTHNLLLIAHMSVLYVSHHIHASLSTNERGEQPSGYHVLPLYIHSIFYNQHFLKFSLINFEASFVPSIQSYCALNVVIGLCDILLIDSTRGCLFAENTLVHLVIHMHHTTTGASRIIDLQFSASMQ